ncbi:MAG: hypothetical protein LKJ25_04470 [Clostridia bacterium]|jgi:hypothetical protein|nr:hypothetical protein [Clostridia bacterium]
MQNEKAYIKMELKGKNLKTDIDGDAEVLLNIWVKALLKIANGSKISIEDMSYFIGYAAYCLGIPEEELQTIDYSDYEQEENAK